MTHLMNYSINQSMSDEAVYRRAPATPGLLKTENFSYQFRAISNFLINLLNTSNIKRTYLLLLWTMVGGRVGYQAWQEFCCVWLELVCQQVSWAVKYLDELQWRAVMTQSFYWSV